MTFPYYFRALLLTVAAGISTTASAQTVENTLRKMAVEVSKNLPMMVNAEVQATSVAASGNRIVYKYNAIKTADKININKLKNEHYENSVNAMCSNPALLNLLKKGAIVTYQFYDSRNTFLFDMPITQRECSGK